MHLPTCLAILLAAHVSAACATMPLPGGLPPGARLALCGDSITEQMRYSSYVEAYLLACAGRGDISVFQFGWGGENAGQFPVRIDRGDLDAFHPTAVTLLYGANDCGGAAWQDWMQAMWVGRVGTMLDRLAARHPATVGHVLLCGPTLFDLDAAGGNAAAVATANDALGRMRGFSVEVARQRGCGFADVRWRMAEVRAAAPPAYRIGGSDGIHPGPNGHLAIAHEILRGLGCGGDIATIRIDASGRAAVSDGHEVVSAGGGTVELASRRWPFCLAAAAPSGPDDLVGIQPWLPFQTELNRFILIVEHAPSSAEVTWGEATRTFSAAELQNGVNLAAAFASTPFDAAFAGLMQRIAAKQAKEREMIKAAGSTLAPAAGWTPADVAARDVLDSAVHAALQPVRHRLAVRPAPR